MRLLFILSVVASVYVMTAPESFAQKSSKGYASEESEKIKEALDGFKAIIGSDPNSYALKALCMPLAPVLKTECEEKVNEVAILYRNAVTLLKDQPEKVDALPDVYTGQYKRARMADMAVTDQIGRARFQITYVSFLMWYIKCFPLPTVGNVPLQVPSGAVGAPQ